MFTIKPTTLFRRNELYILNTGEKGRGLFCREDIKLGETIEVSPMVVYNEADDEHINETLLADYCFSARDLPESICALAKIQNPTKAGCIAMGIISFCNHSLTPNAAITKIKEQSTIFCRLEAGRDIPHDEEICIDYGSTWFFFRPKPFR
jgi:uncharacterized protein